MARSQNAASLVVALADLVREGEADLTEVDPEDMRAVLDALSAWLATPGGPTHSKNALVGP